MKNIALIALFTGILAGQAQAAPPVDPIWPTPADAAPSPLDLAGQLAVTFDAPPTAFKLLFNDFKSQTVRDLTRGLPPLTVNLVQDGPRLIPDSARPQVEADASFEWIIGPGRIWRGFAGGDTAVIPVALQERNANCTHNGHLMLTFDKTGLAASARVRIAGETCHPLQFDGDWMGSSKITAKDRSEFAPVLQRDRKSRSVQLPVQTLDRLTVDVPGLNLQWLKDAAGDAQSVSGLVVGGVNYVAPCLTRLGEDVDCAARALPSYSLAKSLFAGLGLMRLERLYPGTAMLKVSDLLADCPGEGWDDVALIDLLDMASGHFQSSGYEVDEGALETIPFFDAETRAGKLSFACQAYPRRTLPGKLWVYHTSDTFLLGQAMTAALRRHDGQQADLHRDGVAPLWARLDPSAYMDTVMRTYDSQAAPLTGFGLTMTRDDAARFGQFLTPGKSELAQGLLDKTLFEAALQRGGDGQGLEVGLPRLRYSHGFWARDVSKVLGCSKPVWTPFLSGYGGISLVIFPNDVVFYAFGDNNHFDWGQAAKAANSIKGLCQ